MQVARYYTVYAMLFFIYIVEKSLLITKVGFISSKIVKIVIL